MELSCQIDVETALLPAEERPASIVWETWGSLDAVVKRKILAGNPAPVIQSSHCTDCVILDRVLLIEQMSS
jgi:hypothetical protein